MDQKYWGIPQKYWDIPLKDLNKSESGVKIGEMDKKTGNSSTTEI